MDETILEKYADIMLSAVALTEGQNLLIRTEPANRYLAVIVARRAYQRGARYVHVMTELFEEGDLMRERLLHSKDEYLDYFPGGFARFWESLHEENWAYLAMKGQADPRILDEVDAEKKGRAMGAFMQARAPFSRGQMANRIAWTVAFAPTPALAAAILGMEPEDGALDELWRVLIPILKLDEPDPAAAWLAHGAELAARADRLNSLGLETVHFSGPETDLTVGLHEHALWHGGPAQTQDGRTFSPNVPTEEVFTAPHMHRTEGRVRITRPVLVPVAGKIVDEAWIEFKEGRVVDYDAKVGKDVLDQYFAMDDKARYLGELALVDTASPIFQSGRTFYNILFDENAASHIALGKAYPRCLRNGDSLSVTELEAAGMNTSVLHTDFMIGAPEVDVTGHTYDNRTVDVIRNGVFVL